MNKPLAADLIDYEQSKFSLAEILRFAEINLREARPDIRDPFRDLFARLAEDRFNLVVVGRFSRGKSSLMNAMLNTERLPTGILPLTSVITTVSYGSTEKVLIDHENWRIPHEITLDELPDFVTQQGNPGNQRKVSMARVELPAELLRRGFHFVDTPGLGSSIIENTRTTEQFLPQADAFMLITSFDSPLSEEELRVLKGVVSSTAEIFLVINKQDTVGPAERDEVIRHVAEQTRRVFGGSPPRVFSVSARQAIEANRCNDKEAWAASGVGVLRDELTRFLLSEKQRRFLLRMCERIAEAIHDIPNISEERGRLAAMHEDLGKEDQPRLRTVPTAVAAQSVSGAQAFSACRVCSEIERRMYDFLCEYQYDITVSKGMQARLVEQGGLCAFHTWHYDSIASPLGTCTSFPAVLERLAGSLREIAVAAPAEGYAPQVKTLLPDSDRCQLCIVQREFEHTAIAEAVRSLERPDLTSTGDDRSRLCLLHLPLALESLASEDLSRDLLVGEAGMLDRIAEDMRRHVLKHKGVKRYLASDEETTADRSALSVLAGDRNICGPRRRL